MAHKNIGVSGVFAYTRHQHNLALTCEFAHERKQHTPNIIEQKKTT